MGWIGSLLLILGMWLVGSKKRSAFVFGVFGNLIWAIVGLQRNTPDLWFIATIMTMFNARAWFKWKKA